MDSAGRIKVALDYWGAAMYKRENLASLRDVALEGGLPVPDTPVYASSPGVLLLQRQKRRELAEAVRQSLAMCVIWLDYLCYQTVAGAGQNQKPLIASHCCHVIR